MVLKLDIGSTNGKIVSHRQAAHADTVAGLLAWFTQTADFLNSAQSSPFVRITGK